MREALVVVADTQEVAVEAVGRLVMSEADDRKTGVSAAAEGFASELERESRGEGDGDVLVRVQVLV